ncbi:LOW QUALITY PROTEIN: hypothetical protein T265_12556 [Opisthorchis viverrini]|uniref:Uncharacterized protein n=1 Tax=Opisthorchis viverrini TaxID=6198 RepID=A0A075A274_OPIVI|nr:LOW QUALITY PROTEIN: hypothetical protein T265_12556 [Opisthorchis viverrini]KER33813.1 LOW QUALITY PROTEIN: hypothetical protein T265_12556 [Opisthorchis viverrini]
MTALSFNRGPGPMTSYFKESNYFTKEDLHSSPAELCMVQLYVYPVNWFLLLEQSTIHPSYSSIHLFELLVSPIRRPTQKRHASTDLPSAPLAFERHDATKEPPKSHYDGHFNVTTLHSKYFRAGKHDTVSIDCLKLAFIEALTAMLSSPTTHQHPHLLKLPIPPT